MKLDSMGISIDELTAEQEKYINDAAGKNSYYWQEKY